jgi:molecular chaperone GrpE
VTERERPDEEVVRSQLRDEKARVGEGDESAEPSAQSAEGGQTADGSAEAAAETNGAAAEAQPTADSGQPRAPEDKAAEYLDLAKRTQADFENFRKRAAKDMAASGARAKAGLLRELLPVVDNIERALGVVEGSDDGVGQGLKLVYAELQGVLTRNGVNAMEPSGEPFDPTVHEAISTRPADGAEPGTVLDVVEKGYLLGEMVIRPARVVVAA